MAEHDISAAPPNGGPRVAIIGGGPIGLEAAARAAALEWPFDVYEAGEIATHVRQWGHVVLFTPFSMNHSDLGIETIRRDNPDYAPPLADAMLSGRDHVRAYLAPLAGSSALEDHVHTGHRVVSIGRWGLLKSQYLGDERRGGRSFRLLIQTADGVERIAQADVVIDASGTYGNHNWVGNGGIPAVGERSAAAFIDYHLEDINAARKADFSGKHIVLVGAGYTAATSIVELEKLVHSDTRTRVVWMTAGDRNPPIREIPRDSLFARGQLARRANAIALASHPRITHIPSVTVEKIETHAHNTVVVHAADVHCNHQLFEVHRVLANVGYHPDRSLYRELHVHECYATMAPMKLAATLRKQDVHDCLERKPTPEETLVTPEPNFFILGAKSFGRDATFLLATGIAQVDKVFTRLAARRAERV